MKTTQKQIQKLATQFSNTYLPRTCEICEMEGLTDIMSIKEICQQVENKITEIIESHLKELEDLDVKYSFAVNKMIISNEIKEFAVNSIPPMVRKLITENIMSTMKDIDFINRNFMEYLDNEEFTDYNTLAEFSMMIDQEVAHLETLKLRKRSRLRIYLDDSQEDVYRKIHKKMTSGFSESLDSLMLEMIDSHKYELRNLLYNVRENHLDDIDKQCLHSMSTKFRYTMNAFEDFI